MSPLIRILTPDDVIAVRALRLEALRNAPDAFLVSVEAEQANTDDDWRERLMTNESQFIHGAFLDDQLIGMVGARREHLDKMRHTVEVWGTYVRPQSRGQGTCKALLEAQIAYARTLSGVRCLKLGVIVGNAWALKVYESVGYKTFATEPLFMRLQDGTIAGQNMMIFEL